MEKPDYVKQSVVSSLSDLYYIRSMMAILDGVQNSLHYVCSEYPEETRTAFLTIHGVLRRIHESTVNRVLTGCHLLDDCEVRKEALSACLSRLGKDKVVIMDMLEPGGRFPHSWSVSAEDEFRRQIRVALLEVADIDPTTRDEWEMVLKPSTAQDT